MTKNERGMMLMRELDRGVGGGGCAGGLGRGRNEKVLCLREQENCLLK